jgi:sortase family protein
VRPFWLAVSVAVALLGVTLLVTGVVQVIRQNTVSGLPEPYSDDYAIADHQGGLDRQLLSGHAAVAGSTTPPAARSRQPVASTSSTNPTTRPTGPLPNTIQLPAGGTAYLVHGQVAADGSLPVPAGVSQAIWWGAAINAAIGATVVAGHVNWAGRTGPFAELWHDQVGQVVSVAGTDGTVLRFRVTQLLTLSKEELPQQAPTLFSPSGPHRIVLATCGGEWVGGQLGYNDNRVVIAVPVA